MKDETKAELLKTRWRLMEENAELKRKLRLAHELLDTHKVFDRRVKRKVVLRRRVWDGRTGVIIGFETIN
jgi:hypothetical protein